MPLFFQHDIDENSRLAIWRIEEEEEFFLARVPLHRQITHPNKRLQHLAGRYLLRHLFPDFPTELIRIADTRKPFLEEEAYHFSISHCHHFAAAIVSRNSRVGIDIEIPSPKVLRILHKFLHKEEYNRINKDDTGNVELTTLLWSAKEAVFKWWGKGEVDFSEMIRIQVTEVYKEGIFPGSFSKEDLHKALSVHYKLFNDMVLTWVQTEATSRA